MVPTRFAWPHGGRHVFLCGSFSGWTEHSQMMLVEGSSTVFQTTCNLLPGFHQHRFLVDGVWRCDETQPYMHDEYGNVNNFIIVAPPASSSPLVPHPAHPRIIVPHLNGGLLPANAVPSPVHREPVARFSDAELDGSRNSICAFLTRYTAYDLLPYSGKVTVLDVTLPVKQAFRIMYEQGLAVVPIWDTGTEQLVGMLTVSDFILILRELKDRVSALANEELEMHQIFDWKEGKAHTYPQSNGPMSPSRRPIIQASPNDSLKDVALKIVRNNISTVPLTYSVPDGSCPMLLSVASLSEILQYIFRHFRHVNGTVPLLQQPIYAIGLGTWAAQASGEIASCSRRQLTIMQHNAPLSSALNLFMEAQISSIPVVDDNGSLLDVYSRRLFG
ncbi:Sucrose nonfermenting 4-like protein [Acorus calamus]|uniref:Sucrose nonfermenting 4-like protein n=1 Tax=Acorus calamus TaxID=4465 RepID=A0AAV9C3C1_ACOCL|nr:Sucrose nonfermenting 4-like protein [Acorus calamus]